VHDPEMALKVVRIPSLITCPKCGLEMRLIGIEAENPKRELYTFECERCQKLEVRGVRVK
jgi:hypothetical protein